MLASQYIYTACGKEKNGAFSLWAKSKDITEAEGNEIREMMIYKTLAGLPYEPTQEDIDTLFPKKYGYFFLSTGRVCLAQSTYVGKVYSDQDKRWGNYIIHAFVYDKNYDIAPYSLFEHSIFKPYLTRKEWHDDPLPIDLQQENIPVQGDNIPENEINSFLDKERNKLKLLIQSVISSSLENIIHLHENYNQQLTWLKMLSLCLPKALLNNISVCSMFSNTLTPGNISSQIQFRINRPEGSLFNYSQDVQRGKLSLDFVKDVYPTNIQPSKFADIVISLLSNSVSEVEEYVDNISRIMSTYTVNINQATNLYNLSQQNYQYFTNNSELYDTILLAESKSYKIDIIAENIWENPPQQKFTTQLKLHVLAFIFKSITSKDCKFEIMNSIIDNPTQFDINTSDPQTFTNDLRTKTNFVYTNYIDFLRDTGFTNYISQNQKSFHKLYFMFDILLRQPSVINLQKPIDFDFSDETKAIKVILLSAYNKKSLPDIDLLINLANKNIQNLGTELLASISLDIIHSHHEDLNIPFAFEVLNRLYSDKEVAIQYLWFLIEINPTSEEIKKEYIEAQSQHQAFYRMFVDTYKDSDIMHRFLRKVEAYIFTNKPLTQKVIKEYFVKYYVSGDDDGLFVKKLPDYLSGLSLKERLNECEVLLKEVITHQNNTKEPLEPIYTVLLDAIFSVPYPNIYEKCRKDKWGDQMVLIYQSIKQENTLSPDTIGLCQILQVGTLLDKYEKDEKNTTTFFTKTSGDEETIVNLISDLQEKYLCIFLDHYLPLLANIFIMGTTKSNIDMVDNMFQRLFGSILDVAEYRNKISQTFTDALAHSKSNTLDFTLFTLRKYLNSKTYIDKVLGNMAYEYFLKLGDTKKLFKSLLNASDNGESQEFQAFFDDFNKNHSKGFFSRLFSN